MRLSWSVADSVFRLSVCLVRHMPQLILLLVLSLLLVACKTMEPAMPLYHVDNRSLLMQAPPARGIPMVSKDAGSLTDDKTLKTYDPDASDDLWQRIRDGYALPFPEHTHYQSRIDGILKRYQKYPENIYRQTERARLYLHYIVNEIDKNNMPLELALLPFVESSYNPFAYSSKKASGLWQFIPDTGAHFKLNRNWWLDDRRDIVASTQAAIAYLRYLHQHFDHDWLLAVAAYNAGEGTVGRAIRRNKKQGKPVDYWSLPLPRETRFYIPKLLAWASLVKDPARYQLRLAAVDNAPQFAAVDIGSQIDLGTLADITAIDIEQIYALNPQYNHWATDPDAPHRLLLPIDQIDAVKKSIEQHPAEDRIQWKRYTVKANDSLGVIAERFHTSVEAIKNANQLSDSMIRVGRVLLIPQAAKKSNYYTDSVAQRLIRHRKKIVELNKKPVRYRVKNGDTLWGIAKKYNVKLSSIVHWNKISSKEILHKNRILIIWSS